MDKVIFLDVDGVLNTKADGHVEPYLVERFSTIVDKTDTMVVLHSAWRFGFDDQMLPESPEAIELFVELMKEGVYIDDMTPDLSDKEIKRTKMFSLVKAKEIREWLSQNHFNGAWVVIDDKDLNDNMIKTHQIMCDPAKGISWDDVYAAISILEA